MSMPFESNTTQAAPSSLESSTELDKLLPSLCKAKLKISTEGPVVKNQTNGYYNSRYADLAAIDKAIGPILTNNGLFCTQAVEMLESGGIVEITTTLWHESGQYLSKTTNVPYWVFERNGEVRKNIHGMASLITYFRRNLKMSLLDIATGEDDDGNAAVPPPPSSNITPKKAEQIFKGYQPPREPIIPPAPPAPSAVRVTALNESISTLDEACQQAIAKRLSDCKCNSIEELSTEQFNNLANYVARNLNISKNVPIPTAKDKVESEVVDITAKDKVEFEVVDIQALHKKIANFAANQNIPPNFLGVYVQDELINSVDDLSLVSCQKLLSDWMNVVYEWDKARPVSKTELVQIRTKLKMFNISEEDLMTNVATSWGLPRHVTKKGIPYKLEDLPARLFKKVMDKISTHKGSSDWD